VEFGVRKANKKLNKAFFVFLEKNHDKIWKKEGHGAGT
jgi:hypothetical protein